MTLLLELRMCFPSVNQLYVLIFSSGDCNFERPYSECGYSQGKDDDFDWEQVNTKLRPSTDPWIPAGQLNLAVTAHTTIAFSTVFVGLCTFSGPKDISVWLVKLDSCYFELGNGTELWSIRNGGLGPMKVVHLWSQIMWLIGLVTLLGSEKHYVGWTCHIKIAVTFLLWSLEV